MSKILTGKNIPHVGNNISKGIGSKGLHGKSFILAGKCGSYKRTLGMKTRMHFNLGTLQTKLV